MQEPLLAWAIKNAKSANITKEVHVNTDSYSYAEIAKAYGAETPFLRPPDLSSDQSLAIDVYIHHLFHMQEAGKFYEDLMVLQPTSPLRFKSDIKRAYLKYKESNCLSLLSVTEFHGRFSWLLNIDDSKKVTRITSDPILLNRQAEKKIFSPNGAIFIVNTKHFIAERTFYFPSTEAYVMAQQRSIDIDTEDDLETAELIAASKYHHEYK